MKEIIGVLFFLVALLSLCACSKSSSTGTSDQSSGVQLTLPADYPAAEVLDISVSRKKLQEFLSRTGDINKIRMIESFHKGDPLPRYHLFDVKDNSVYTLLGLRNRDVLVSANDFIIYEPQKFIIFLKLLHKEQNAWIRVQRDDKDVKLAYTFID